ncbi:PHP domain-containing protein [Desulfonatronovibrio hydrogenovorans]|uniref:PHP domain-containing protein n=1 Tax=Desulfonatronovibrio hydrogenovorans TaxID=53245 RepID=UPI00048B3CC9|nr:PHP domain-containing protein [Desulfonatronovibrio hydrogenovorans]
MSQIDLHTHSTASDGTFTPPELVRHAVGKGLDAIALTDHDTTGGLAQALKAGQELGLELIPGCELSVEYKGLMHILGLWLKPDAPELNRSLAELRAKRNSRNEIMLGRLQELGIRITFEDVKSLAGDAAIGRPHISRVLMNKGVVNSVQEAFDRFLGPKGKAYVAKEKFDPAKAISILKKEQATVILAHPFSLKLSPELLRQELVQLKELGLDGVEVFYPEHTREQTRLYLDLCQELDLLPSGGSDFHGTVKPQIKLGKGRGKLDLPYSLLQTMKDRRQEQGLWV